MFGMLEGVMGVRVAYSYSLYFSDQLSCIKYFHLNYGLKDIEFQSLNHFIAISRFLLIIKATLSKIGKLTGQLIGGTPMSLTR